MPQENNYESRLEELRTRETEIRQRLAQIAEERTNEMNDVAGVYGVNATEVDLGTNSEREKLQEELAKITGTTRQTIIAIEKNNFNPSAKLALILCYALDAKFEDLFYF